MHPYHHSLSSAKKFGGVYTDYLDFHTELDAVSKSHFCDSRHRALRHFVEWGEDRFGRIDVPGNWQELFNQHLDEDMDIRATAKDWAEALDGVPSYLRTRAPNINREAFKTTVLARFPGVGEDFRQKLTDFFFRFTPESGDPSHYGMFRLHSLGIYEAELRLGAVRDGVPTRYVCEKTFLALLGRIPTVSDWLTNIRVLPWMQPTKIYNQTA